MMLIPGLNKYQDAPDGLYQQYHNSRTQDSSVGPSGVHHLVTPPLATGVVNSLATTAHFGLILVTGLKTMVHPLTAHKLLHNKFVPSGV